MIVGLKQDHNSRTTINGNLLDERASAECNETIFMITFFLLKAKLITF